MNMNYSEDIKACQELLGRKYPDEKFDWILNGAF